MNAIKKIMSIKNIKIYFLVLAIVSAVVGYKWISSGETHVGDEKHEHADEAENEHGDEHDSEKEEDHGDEHGESEAKVDDAKITKQNADKMGIKVESVSSAIVSERIALSGRITLNQNATAQVKARFPGMVSAVQKGEGESVNKGDMLANIEGNESLQTYAVKSPISGVIIARNTNVGDVAGDAALFTITDTSTVWAEFHIFPRDIDRIKIGQKVLITSFEGGHTAEAIIVTLLPITETSSQTVVARATIENPEGLWRAGMTVQGEVIIAEQKVPLAVKTSAIQRLEGVATVFVKKGEEQYEARPILTGASDSDWTAVLEGLQVGENYVSEKSFLVKADIGKAGAAHEH